jgi:hypothetical protein
MQKLTLLAEHILFFLAEQLDAFGFRLSRSGFCLRDAAVVGGFVRRQVFWTFLRNFAAGSVCRIKIPHLRVVRQIEKVLLGVCAGACAIANNRAKRMATDPLRTYSESALIGLRACEEATSNGIISWFDNFSAHAKRHKISLSLFLNFFCSNFD